MARRERADIDKVVGILMMLYLPIAEGLATCGGVSRNWLIDR
jgi:hypothetical protein